jgi:hypothetical protein
MPPVRSNQALKHSGQHILPDDGRQSFVTETELQSPSSFVIGITLLIVAACVGVYNKPDNYEDFSATIRSYEN